ncbi:MAG: hypothetical protein JWP82_2105 [Humibacillus sp.]|nr:hypothetical protein [Humibacillus sp.]
MSTFASIRIITADLDRLVGFYERLLGRPAARLNPLFAELRASTGTLAFGDIATTTAFGEAAVQPAANRSVIIEVQVDDVDDAFSSLATAEEADRPHVVQEPTTMPWGNRSAIVRDPDGNLVNLFAPVTAQAQQRFA